MSWNCMVSGKSISNCVFKAAWVIEDARYDASPCHVIKSDWCCANKACVYGKKDRHTTYFADNGD